MKIIWGDLFGIKRRRQEWEAARDQFAKGMMEKFEEMRMKAAKSDVTPILGPWPKDFDRIDEIRIGTRVKWAGPEFKDQKWPALNEVIEVYSLIPPTNHARESGAVDRFDFSALYRLPDGTIQEYEHDSRRFVIVEPGVAF